MIRAPRPTASPSLPEPGTRPTRFPATPRRDYPDPPMTDSSAMSANHDTPSDLELVAELNALAERAARQQQQRRQRRDQHPHQQSSAGNTARTAGRGAREAAPAASARAPGSDSNAPIGAETDASRLFAARFEVLFRRHRGFVYRLALHFTGQDADAAEITQETFIYLLGKFPGLELRARLTTLLYPAVKNLALAKRRKRRPDLLSDNAWEAVEHRRADPGTGSAADRTGANRTGAATSRPSDATPVGFSGPLAAALDALPAAHREVLILRFVYALALHEITIALDVPEGTVKSRLHHALKGLRADARCAAFFRGQHAEPSAAPPRAGTASHDAPPPGDHPIARFPQPTDGLSPRSHPVIGRQPTAPSNAQPPPLSDPAPGPAPGEPGESALPKQPAPPPPRSRSHSP